MSETVTLSVPEVHCEHCETSISGALRGLEGVRSVTVDLPARTVTVEYDEPANLAVVSAALADVGYDVAGVVSTS